MSDQMLIEDWRKFLAEEEEALEEAWPSWKRAGYNDPKFKLRSWWQKIKALFQQKWNQKEEVSDNLLQQLGTKQPWKDIFEHYDWAGMPSERALQVIFEKYGMPYSEEWKATLLFVLVSREADKNEGTFEWIDGIAEAIGAGGSLTSQIGAVGVAAFAVGVGPEGDTLADYVGAPTEVLYSLAVAGVFAGILGPLRNAVQGWDEEKIRKALKKTGGDYRLPRARKALSELEMFYTAEFEILHDLVARPTELPSVSAEQIYADPAPYGIDPEAIDENKFHDDWREFLLTEEKK